MTAPDSVLDIQGLSVDYRSPGGWTTIVSDATFQIGRGEIFGVAGESGSGKSTLGYALLAHRRDGSRISSGRVLFRGRDLLSLKQADLRGIRGKDIAYVPQNPTMSLSPTMTVGRQIAEVLRFHRVAPDKGVKTRVLELLAAVGIPEPSQAFAKFPYQMSGGQQQRVLIAMAVACGPAMVVLDEPTTGLDVTTQAKILRLLVELRDKFGSAFFYVSHDLGALSSICDRIGIMYAGKMVEIAPAERLFAAPVHPYTRGLIASVPRLDKPPDRGAALRGVLRRDQLGAGCPFAPRCPMRDGSCSETPQVLEPIAVDRFVACHRWRSVGVVP